MPCAWCRGINACETGLPREKDFAKCIAIEDSPKMYTVLSHRPSDALAASSQRSARLPCHAVTSDCVSCTSSFLGKSAKWHRFSSGDHVKGCDVGHARYDIRTGALHVANDHQECRCTHESNVFVVDAMQSKHRGSVTLFGGSNGTCVRWT